MDHLPPPVTSPMQNQLTPKKKKLFYTWIIGVFFLFFIPTAYLILKDQFHEKIFERGIRNTVAKNFPFLKVEMTPAQFKISSKIKYDVAHLTLRTQQKSPFESVEFTNLKVRVPILFLLGGRKIEISADEVIVKGLRKDSGRELRALFNSPNLHLNFPLLVRNNKFNANFTSVIFKSESTSTIQIEKLQNTILRDINFKYPMAMETTVSGVLNDSKKMPFALQLTGEFNLLDMILSSHSKFRFFAQTKNFPLAYLNSLRWEMTPYQKSGGKGDFAVSLQQVGQEDSDGISGNLRMENLDNLQINLSGDSLRKSDLQSLISVMNQGSLDEIDSSQKFSLQLKLNFLENHAKSILDLEVLEEKSKELFFSIKPLNSGKHLYTLFFRGKTKGEEQRIYSSVFANQSSLESLATFLDLESKDIREVLKDGPYPWLSWIQEQTTDVFPERYQNVGSRELPWKLVIDNISYDKTLQKLEGMAKISSEGISFYSLNLTEMTSKRHKSIPHMDAKVVFRPSKENPKSDSSLIISMNLKHSPADLWSWIFFGENILLSGKISGQIVSTFNGKDNVLFEAKAKVEKPSFDFPLLAKELKMNLPEKKYSLFPLPLEWQSIEVIASRTSTRSEIQAIFTPPKNNRSEKVYMQLDKNLAPSSSNNGNWELQLFTKRSPTAPLAPLFQVELEAKSLELKSWALHSR